MYQKKTKPQIASKACQILAIQALSIFDKKLHKYKKFRVFNQKNLLMQYSVQAVRRRSVFYLNFGRKL